MEEEYGIKLKIDLSDISKQVKKAKSMAKDIESSFREVKVTGLDGTSKIKIDTSSVEEVKENLEEVADVKKRIASGEIKITGLDPLKDTLSDAEYEANRLQRSLENTGKFQSDFGYLGLEELQEDLKETENEEEEVGKKAEEAGQKIKKSFNGASLKQKLIPALSSISSKFKSIKKDTDSFGKSIASNATRGIKSLKRFALSLFGVQSAYRAVTKAIHSYLAYDEQLSKSIQNTWVGLGSFFAPILEYLVSAFQKLLAYINALVQALTGINFVARANEKALQKMGASAGSTAKAMKQLGGFDELNNINTDTGGASGGGADVGQIELPEIDTSKLDVIFEIFDKIKYWAGELFAPIKNAWDKVGAELVKSVERTFNSIVELGKTIFMSLFEVWTNGTGQQIIENGIVLWTNFFDIITNVVDAITNAWNNNNNGTEILQNIANIIQDIQKFALLVADTLKKWTASKEFQEALNFIFELVKDITGWIEKIANWILDMWSKYVKPILDEKVMPLVGALIELLKTIWENVLKPLVEKVTNILKPLIENVIKGFTSKIGNIMDVLKAVANFLTGVFKGDWKKAFDGIKDIVVGVLNTIKDTFSNIFNSIWGVIKGIINLMIGGFETFANAGIKAINKVFSPLTKVGNKALKLLGIDSFKFSAVSELKLPRLSVGTDEVLSEGLAYLHAGEKVVPADVVKGGYSGSDNEETNNLLRQLITLIDEKNYEPYIRVDDIGSASVKYINKQQRITGEAII